MTVCRKNCWPRRTLTVACVSVRPFGATSREVREDSGPQNKGISDNESSDQKTIYSRVQSPGRRPCWLGETGGGGGRGSRHRHEPPLRVDAQGIAAWAAR